MITTLPKKCQVLERLAARFILAANLHLNNFILQNTKSHSSKCSEIENKFNYCFLVQIQMVNVFSQLLQIFYLFSYGSLIGCCYCGTSCQTETRSKPGVESYSLCFFLILKLERNIASVILAQLSIGFLKAILRLHYIYHTWTYILT